MFLLRYILESFVNPSKYINISQLNTAHGAENSSLYIVIIVTVHTPQNGSSMMKVAEGAVSSTVEILKTLKEKAVNAANDSNTDSDRQTIQKELNQSIDQINDNANVTFNGKYLVDGSKNTIGNATYTALSNQSLKTDTTAATKLTDLAARSGDSLEIHDTDKVTVSYVKGGKTYSTTYQVKDTTLQDIFNKAEEVNKAEIGATYDAVKDALFASADNKSVGAAMVADKQMSQSDYDNIAATKQAAIDAADAAKTTATTGLDARITTLTTDAVYTNAKKAVDDYNTAVANWAAIAGTGSTGTNRVGAEPYTNAGEYMDNLLAADNNEFNTVATGGVNLSNVTDAITAAGVAATGAANLDDAVTAAKAALDTITDTALKDKLKANIDKLVDSGAVQTAAQLGGQIGTADTSGWAKLSKEVTTAATAVKTAYEAVVNTATGDLKTGAYKNYVDAKIDYTTKKDYADTFTNAKILTGKTVGLAASNDTVGTASGENAITITANTAGIGGQISGLNISITDSEGNVKKSANAALDAFEETIRAQNESDDNAITLQVGAKANQSIKVGLTDMRAEALGLQGADGTKLNISTQTKANAAINVLDNAIAKALDQQTTIGSVESRLEYTSSNLSTASENVQASESTIRDADMAKEMTEYTKNNVLLQAAQSMLAQANQSSSNVLSLLQ